MPAVGIEADVRVVVAGRDHAAGEEPRLRRSTVGLPGQLRAGRRGGLLSADAAERLSSAWRALWRLHAATRLLTERPLDMEEIGRGGQAFLLREAGVTDADQLSQEVARHVADARALIEADMPATGD